MMSAFTKVTWEIVFWRQTNSRIEFKTWAKSLCAVRLPPTPQTEYHPSVVVGASAQHLGRIGRLQRCPALPNAYTPRCYQINFQVYELCTVLVKALHFTSTLAQLLRCSLLSTSLLVCYRKSFAAAKRDGRVCCQALASPWAINLSRHRFGLLLDPQVSCAESLG